MRKAYIYALVILLAMTGLSRGQDAPKNATGKENHIKIEFADEPAMVLGTMRITLGQAIEWAVKKNLDMLTVSYDVAMTDTMYQQFQKKFATSLNLDIGGLYAKYTKSMQFLYGMDEKKIDATASVYKNFSSGTTIIGGLKHEYSDITRDTATMDIILPGMSQALGPAQSHKPSVFITVQQELLKNAFGYSDRKQEEILKNATKMQKDAIIFQLSLVIVQVIGEYWDLVVNKITVENAELQLKETRTVRDITARNVQYGLAENFNLNYYNALVSGAEARLVAARQQYRDSLRSFLRTINVPENTEVTGTAVFSDKLVTVSLEETLKTAFKKRTDYQNALLALENAKMALKISSNATLPSLTAELNVASTAEEADIGKSYRDAASVNYPAIEGRLKLSYPLYDKEVITQERNARFRLKQATLQVDKYRRLVKDDVVSKVETIETSYLLYKKAKEARKEAELFYRRMLANLQRGRLNAALVKNGVDALVESRQQELLALVYYNIALIQLDVAKNELFDKYDIDIEKYIPKDK